MTEKLNSNLENADTAPSSYEQSMADAPAFDKEAARKARIEAYKEAHPDAVEDVEKARAMAEAGDVWETSAVRHLENAKKFSSERGNTKYQKGDILPQRGSNSAILSENSDGKIILTSTTSGNSIEKSNQEYPDALEKAKDALDSADYFEALAGEEYDKNKKIQNLKIDDLRKSMKDNQ